MDGSFHGTLLAQAQAIMAKAQIWDLLTPDSSFALERPSNLKRLR